MKEHRPWLWLLCSSATVLVGLALLAAGAGQAARAGRYDDARSCPEAATADRCVLDTFAVVTDRRASRHRSDDFHLTLALPDGRTVRTELLGDDGVWREATVGRRLAVRVYDGRVTRLATPGGLVEETAHSPRVDATGNVVFGFLGVVWGAAGMRSAFRFRSASGGWRRRAGQFGPGLWPVDQMLVAAAAAAAVPAVQFQAFDVTSPVALLAGGLVSMTMFEVWILRRHGSR